MDSDLLDAAPAPAASDQRADNEADQQPRVDGREQRHEETEPRPIGSIGRLIHRACTILPVVGLCVIQVVWVALLGYAVYWIGVQLPP